MALVTDVGNDLLYGFPVPQIIAWVETCLDRLAAQQATTVITLPPVCSLPGLTRRRYELLVRMFFPGSPIGYADAMRGAEALCGVLDELAQQRCVAAVAPSAEWYGWDPIHVRWRLQRPVWEKNFLIGPPATTMTATIARRASAGAIVSLFDRKPTRFLGAGFAARSHVGASATVVRHPFTSVCEHCVSALPNPSAALENVEKLRGFSTSRRRQAVARSRDVVVPSSVAAPHGANGVE